MMQRLCLRAADLTRNDQAWVEQTNGAVVRRIVGYRRFAGLEAAAVLAQLYRSVRLFVNFFQPSFKLAEKSRDGVRKRYHPPATPYQRLIADARPRSWFLSKCLVSRRLPEYHQEGSDGNAVDGTETTIRDNRTIPGNIFG